MNNIIKPTENKLSPKAHLYQQVADGNLFYTVEISTRNLVMLHTGATNSVTIFFDDLDEIISVLKQITDAVYKEKYSGSLPQERKVIEKHKSHTNNTTIHRGGVTTTTSPPNNNNKEVN